MIISVPTYSRTTPLPRRYRCINASGALLSDTIATVDNVTLTLPPRTLAPHPGYQFSVMVTKDTRNSSASVVIRVIPGVPPGISVGGLTADAYLNPNDADDGTHDAPLPPPGYPHSFSRPLDAVLRQPTGAFLALEGQTQSSSGIQSIDWTQETGSGSSVFAIETSRLITAIALWKMSPGVIYTFRLTVHDFIGNTAFGEVIVTINAPPSSGSCAVAPVRGCDVSHHPRPTALASSFTDARDAWDSHVLARSGTHSRRVLPFAAIIGSTKICRCTIRSALKRLGLSRACQLRANSKQTAIPQHCLWDRERTTTPCWGGRTSLTASAR